MSSSQQGYAEDLWFVSVDPGPLLSCWNLSRSSLTRWEIAQFPQWTWSRCRCHQPLLLQQWSNTTLDWTLSGELRKKNLWSIVRSRANEALTRWAQLWTQTMRWTIIICFQIVSDLLLYHRNNHFDWSHQSWTVYLNRIQVSNAVVLPFRRTRCLMFFRCSLALTSQATNTRAKPNVAPSKEWYEENRPTENRNQLWQHQKPTSNTYTCCTM